MARKYVYRGLGCNILPDERLWAVSGSDLVNDSAGVLEWCWDQKDAETVLELMQSSGEFSDLNAGPWLTHPNRY